MAKYLEIKWQGRPGQGVVTAARVLAEVLALEGKYVQAFPEFIAQKRRPSILAFNRFSGSPVKTHAGVYNADMVVLMDARLLLHTDVKENAGQDAAYLVNTSYTPDFIIEKLHLSENNKIYTLDADTIVKEEIGLPIPNIPLMGIVLGIMDLMPMEKFQERLKQVLALTFNPDLTAANLRTLERALSEVKQL